MKFFIGCAVIGVVLGAAGVRVLETPIKFLILDAVLIGLLYWVSK